jgi:hypothetical protein
LIGFVVSLTIPAAGVSLYPPGRVHDYGRRRFVAIGEAVSSRIRSSDQLPLEFKHLAEVARCVCFCQLGKANRPCFCELAGASEDIHENGSPH